MFSNYADYFESIREFIQVLVSYLGHGINNLDKFPDLFQDISDWISYVLDFLPSPFQVILLWFICASMLIRFLRW